MRAAAPHKFSDPQFCRQFAAGDHAAFEAVYREYRLLLLSDVQRLMPSFDSHTVDDVVQQAFVRIWEHRVRLSQAANLKAILQKITRDFAVDALRRRQRSTGVPLSPGIPSNCDSPTANLQREELAREIERVCATLTDAESTAFELRLSGLSAKAVAERVGCSLATAKRRHRKAIQRLFDCLPAEHD